MFWFHVCPIHQLWKSVFITRDKKCSSWKYLPRPRLASADKKNILLIDIETRTWATRCSGRALTCWSHQIRVRVPWNHSVTPRQLRNILTPPVSNLLVLESISLSAFWGKFYSAPLFWLEIRVKFESRAKFTPFLWNLANLDTII